MAATIPLGSIATAMGRAGLHVFPVWPGQKRPATRNGLHAATNDPHKIAAWWQRIPSANIGIACEPSRLLVIDCDRGKPWPLAGDTPPGVSDGADVLQLLAEENGEPDLLYRPGTLSVATPSGGLHLYFRAPQGQPVKSSAGKLAPWVDVRAMGGYAVAPFSSTPVGDYRPILGWENVASADADSAFRPVGIPAMESLRIDPPEAPAWLLGRLLPKQSPEPVGGLFDRLLRALDATSVANLSAWAAKALAEECGNVTGAPEGTRNDTLNRAAFAIGTIVGAGHIGEGEASAALLSAALSAGLPEAEASACIRSGMRAGVASPRGVTGQESGARSARSARNESGTPVVLDGSGTSGTPIRAGLS